MKKIKKERNLIAKDLLTSKLYKPKIIQSKKIYKRKSRSSKKIDRDFFILLWFPFLDFFLFVRNFVLFLLKIFQKVSSIL